VYKCVLNHYPIISIHLLYKKVAFYNRDSDRYRILFNWLVAVRHAEVLKHADVFLLCWLRDISNKAGSKADGYLKNSELLVFDTCCIAFLWTGWPSYRLQFPAMSFSTAAYVCWKYALSLSCPVLYCRYVCENASPEICLVSSREPIYN
jgi:hypothetical protein